jgi:glycine/D-amino acid oxidase-like deaminating enzyme
MVTVARDLRAGRSAWTARRLPPLRKTRLHRAEFTDVLVVGAGISGALIAEMLAADGHRVLVVDRRGPALGSTAASTALVQYEIDTPLTRLADSIGAADAARAWRRAFLATRGLLARTCALGIDAGQESRDSLYLAGDMLDADALAGESAARRAIGIETTLLDRKALRERAGIDRPAALLSHGGFSADPRRLAAGFLRAALAHGARLAAPVDIADIEHSPDRVVAHTRHGWIACRTIVFATGYEFPTFIPLRRYRLLSTYAIATAPQPRRLWPGQEMIWEASNPYLYLRTTIDGRAIIGGEDVEFVDERSRDALLAEKTETLARKAKELLPRLDSRPDFAWTGTFGASDTGLPTIGPIPGHPACWAVLGYGGNGTAFSRLAAEIIRTALAGGTDADADLFAFRPPAR